MSSATLFEGFQNVFNVRWNVRGDTPCDVWIARLSFPCFPRRFRDYDLISFNTRLIARLVAGEVITIRLIMDVVLTSICFQLFQFCAELRFLGLVLAERKCLCLIHEYPDRTSYRGSVGRALRLALPLAKQKRG